VFRRAASLIVITISAAHAQPADTSPRFEVVSVRPAQPPSGVVRIYFKGKRGGPGTSRPTRMEFGHYTVARLISDAYGVELFEISCPAWIYSDQFDINAKVPEGATKAQIPTMIQTLLADRFQLKVHQEMREMPIYELTAVNGGPKLKPVTTDVDRRGEMTGMPSEGRDGFPKLPPNVANIIGVDGRWRLQDPDTDIAQFAKSLARQVGKPVTDATGLKGRYNISLYWAEDSANAGPGATNAEAEAPDIEATSALGPNIFRALKQQLGLRLDAKKGPASILVVDSVTRVPTGN
jgi:uncharacterized protein (TIGR03435 family)